MPYTRQARKNPTDAKCKCRAGEYQCRRCYNSLIAAIEQRMSQEDRAYDRLAMSGFHSHDPR